MYQRIHRHISIPNPKTPLVYHLIKSAISHHQFVQSTHYALLRDRMCWDSMHILCGLVLVLDNTTSVTDTVRATALWLGDNNAFSLFLWLHEWPVTLGLVISQAEEANNNGNPIHVI